MIALERRARSFFLLCRASTGQKRVGTPVTNPALRARGLANAAHKEHSNTAGREQKPFYVTSPIFYVNSAPHAGHLYTLVLTDILKRWAKLRGDDRAALLTGTDEHGMKIQKAAQNAQTDVKVFCDRHAQQFQSLCDAANIDYDRFIRTTDEDHKKVVSHVWTQLNHAGYLYEAKHEGWYCVSDETYYPESRVQRILDPSTGNLKIVSTETGKEVEWTSETNYHFRLSAFQDRLLKHYAENPKAIIPKQRMAAIVDEIESGLSDLSVSRPASRLSWGIPVPGDDTQTIYVWLDALFNYLTMTGYPSPHQAPQSAVWPPDVQVIGKDIIRFHTIYWPAFLMALNLPLTKRFLSHAHWTMNNEKMSKSAGNGVNPFYAMERYGVDTIRFYMAHNGGIVDDAMYENANVAVTYKHVLMDGLGNLLHRVFKSKIFNVRQAVDIVAKEQPFASHLAQKLPDGDESLQVLLDGIKELSGQLTLTRKSYRKWMDEPNPRTAANLVTQQISLTNKFFQKSALWNRIKSQDPIEGRLAQLALFMSAESIRIIAILLQPFMPQKMKVALDMMHVDESRRSFDFARVGADFNYGPPPLEDGAKPNAAEAIFPVLLSAF